MTSLSGNTDDKKDLKTTEQQDAKPDIKIESVEPMDTTEENNKSINNQPATKRKKRE